MAHFHTIVLQESAVAFPCAPDDTILRAGLRSGIGLPYECSMGGCGSCKFDLLEGEVFELWPDAPGLRPRDRQRGKRLACQCVPRGPCIIGMREHPRFRPHDLPRKRQARLIYTHDVTRDIRRLGFQSDAPSRFQAGQYALIGLGAGQPVRAYSMSNPAGDEGIWEFMVRRVPNGQLSKKLFDDTPVGSVAELDGPYGLAFLRENDRPIVCVGGGSGIGPMISILATWAQRGGCRGEAHLFYGGRTIGDIPDIASLLNCAGKKVNYHTAISGPECPAEWAGSTGYVHDLLSVKLREGLAAYEYYVAGPAPMIEATSRMLIADFQVPATQVHYDRFF